MTQWGLDTIFNPAKRHMDDEKRRLQSTREEVGDNSGGKRIDFESGKVRIPGAADDADAQTETDDPAIAADGAGDDEAAPRGSSAGQKAAGRAPAGKSSGAGKSGAARGTDGGGAEPTAAQLRAAARRGRKLG